MSTPRVIGDQAIYQGRLVGVVATYNTPNPTLEPGEQPQVSHHVVRDGDKTITVLPAELSPYVPPAEGEKTSTSSAIYINTVSGDAAIAALGVFVRSRAAAKKIVDHRPETGYASFEQFKELNDSVAGVDWVVAEAVLKF